MGKTSIEWTDASWNPIVGCTEVSPGCANCYAARLAATRLRSTKTYAGLAIPYGNQQRWTGDVRFLPDRLDEPLHWEKPQRIFVCDMGDLFHESVTDEQIWRVFYIMWTNQWEGKVGHRSAPGRHTFQVLTKRPDRMREFILKHMDGPLRHDWPLKNVWLGVSVENQHFAEERIPALLATPAAVRWISAEPLLGPIDLPKCAVKLLNVGPYPKQLFPLDWVVCGGESGPNARPMHPQWARSLRDQCKTAGVPFFFKQWGEWIMGDTVTSAGLSLKVGKKRAGRLLDGREWNEFPKGEHHGCTD